MQKYSGAGQRQTASSFASRLVGVAPLAIAATLGGLAVAPAAFAQTVQKQTDEDVVVVTGTAIPVEYEQVGSAITVLRGDLLEESGYTYITDALRQVPGLAVSRTGPFGGLTQVRVRGSEGNHVVVLFNGVDVSDAGNGETDLSRLLTADIERIEVLRGPQSGLYGSNALAGVINILTRKNVNGYYGTGSAEYGSFGTTELKAGLGVGDGVNYLTAGFDTLDTDGFDSSKAGNFGSTFSYTNDKEGFNNKTGYVTGGYQVIDYFRVDGFVRNQTGNADLDGFDFSGIPGRQGYAFDNPSRSETENTNYAAIGTLTLLDGAWITKAGWNRTNNLSLSFPGNPNALGIPLGNQATSGNKAARNKLTLETSYTFGPENFVSTVSGFVENKEETYRNLFPSAASQIPQLKRKLDGVGLQYHAAIADQLYVTATARRDNNDTFDDGDTYGVSASWVVPNSGTRVHGSIGNGITNPSFFEQFGFTPGSFVGNPTLVPEKADSWDIGVEQRFLDNTLIVDLTYFKSKLEDEIISCQRLNPAPPPATLSSSCNSTADSDRSGLEAYATWVPSDDLRLVGSYTYLDATEGPAKLVEVRRPENTASFDGYWTLMEDALTLSAGLTYNGEQYDNDFRQGFTAIRTKMDSYTLARIGASYQLTDTIELYGRVENVFDTDYEEVLTYATPGQAAYVGLRFKFGPAAK